MGNNGDTYRIISDKAVQVFENPSLLYSLREIIEGTIVQREKNVCRRFEHV